MRARRSSSEDADTSLRAVLLLETPTYLVSNNEDWDVEEARSAVTQSASPESRTACYAVSECSPGDPSIVRAHASLVTR